MEATAWKNVVPLQLKKTEHQEYIFERFWEWEKGLQIQSRRAYEQNRPTTDNNMLLNLATHARVIK